MSRVEQRIDVGEVQLHVVSEGEGPPVVLLHGFPECWYSWRHQLRALADAGFRAIAPDLRGYNLSDKPAHVRDYTLPHLERDVAGLLRALGYDRAHLVGHDWGGVLAWTFAARHPEQVDRLAVLNGPHPACMARALLRPAQLRKSWYIFAFQLPWLPELQTRRPGFIRAAMRGWAVHPERFPDEELRVFEEAYRQPGAARAAINWYRAVLRRPWTALSPLPRVEPPTLVVWGEQDRALGPEVLEGLEREVRDLRVRRLPSASHWVQQDAPEEVNRALVEFFQER